MIFAVNHKARATGWMKRLIVSIITSIGINGVGVPFAKKWASEAFSFVVKACNYSSCSERDGHA